MTIFAPPPMPDHCPWGGFTPPNVDWCEAELCTWITNPANTWSNLAYIALGIVMWYRARGAARSLGWFGPASITVGVFSFVYHASYTWFLQFFDFVGMFVFAMLVVTLNFRRLGVVGERRMLAFYLGGVTLFSALVVVFHYAGLAIQPLVGVLILVILAQEARLWRTGPHGRFLLALALLTAGGVCSALDLSRVWCDPDNHWLQGHAAWHLLTAASLFVLQGFYARLEE